MENIADRLNAVLAGRYRVERELGAGGMATVYLADDVKHRRKVALKVLRPELAAVIGADRFLKEIETTANLQHPHILPLHDSGTLDGTVFYVMPFVEGESLRDRLNRERQLPLNDAVRIATEVASALDYAHRKGVIHRDIKPENILLHEGQALVADFGIALAAATTGGSRMTETGMSLGTPHYMSPEQAMGERTLDSRADVYALGCVMYEMLVGEPPFTGPTAQAIVARVLTGIPEAPSVRRSTVPANVNAAVLTALQKLPADRFASAAQFAEALHDSTYGATTALAETGSLKSSRSRNGLSIASAVVATAALMVAAWAVATRNHSHANAVLRVSMELPDSMELTVSSENRLAISPDGSRIVFTGHSLSSPSGIAGPTSLWIRSREQLAAVRIPGTEGARLAFFSVDGKHVGFLANRASLKVVDVDGGPPNTVADTGLQGGTASFGPDGSIYATAGSGIVRFAPNGGPPVKVTSVDVKNGESGHGAPEVLPNGRGMLFRVTHVPSQVVGLYDIAVLDFKTGKHRVLLRGVVAHYVDGFVVLVRADGVLAAARFDEDKLALTGPEIPIATGVHVGPFGVVHLALSREGTLVYVGGGAVSSVSELIWVSRGGLVKPVDSTWQAAFEAATISPDGKRLAVAVLDGNSADVWTKQLDDGPKAKLTFGTARQNRPTWLPDGQKVAFVSEEKSPIAIVAKRADGNGDGELVVQDKRNIASGFVSHDGRWAIYRTSSAALGRGNILAQRIGDTVAIPLLVTAADERHPALSPDGRLLAYRSDETGRDEVYVRPFPNVGDGKWGVSSAGGSDPVWAHSGRELFYVNEKNEMIAAIVVTQPTFSTKEQRVLFKLPVGTQSNVSAQRYDVAPDDKRFLMIRAANAGVEANTREHVILVTNFIEELKAKVPARP